MALFLDQASFFSPSFSRVPYVRAGLRRLFRFEIYGRNFRNMALESGRDSAHMIMFSSPMHSHCVPYIRLAKKLIDLGGINITFINLENVISVVKATEEVKLLMSESKKLRLVSIPNGDGYKSSDSPLVLTNTLGERASNAFASCLERLMKGDRTDWGPPCCGIFDFFVCGWLLKIADRFNLPSYSFWTATTTSLAFMMHVAVLRTQGHIPVNTEEGEKLALVEVPCIPPVHPFEFIGALQFPNHPMHQLLLNYDDHHVQLRGIFVNSNYDLESSVFDALTDHYVARPGSKLRSIVPVGPLVPTSVFMKEAKCEKSEEDQHPVLEWLDLQPVSSVIYISFGSIATLSAAQITELAFGLEASGQRFVWVVRPPSDPSMVAAHSEACSYLPPGFEDRMNGIGMVVTSWAPQVQILQHPATGGYLTHCGWNSILESIGAGVPMLTWPIQAEQMLNSRWLVEDVRAAFRVRRNAHAFITRVEVEETVTHLMCTEEGRVAKKNVARLQIACGNPSLSDQNLRKFVEDLLLQSTRQ